MKHLICLLINQSLKKKYKAVQKLKRVLSYSTVYQKRTFDEIQYKTF